MDNKLKFTLKDVQINWRPDLSKPEELYPLEKYDSVDVVAEYFEKDDHITVTSITEIHHPNIDIDSGKFCLGESYEKLIKEACASNELDLVKHYVLIFLTYSGGVSNYWDPIKVDGEYKIPTCIEEDCFNFGIYQDGMCEECCNEYW